jgi:hypothetical protein
MPVKKTKLGQITCALSLAVCSSAYAFNFDYTLQAGAGHSDNINESETDPVGESILIPKMTFTVDEKGADVQATAVGDIEYRDYLGGDFNNELRGQLSSVVNWIISPQRFSFDFEDYAAVAPVNILATNAPNNLQQTNVFTLGPTFSFRIDPTLNFQTDLRFTNSLASQTDDFNSNRGLAAVHAIKLLDPTTQISANVTYEDVHFTDPLFGSDPDYRRAEIFGRYQKKLASLDLDVSLGYSRLYFSRLEDQSGLLARGTLTYHLDTENSFGVGFARQFSDSSQDMAVDPAAMLGSGLNTGIVVGTTAITSQVFLLHQFNANYVFQNERFTVRVAPYYNRYEYEAAPELNQTSHGGVIGIAYRLAPLWTLGLDAFEETREYRDIDRRDEDLRFDLSLLRQFTPHWSGRLDYLRNERNSTAFDEGFRENVFMVTVIYKR